jgi:hypothetical protein
MPGRCRKILSERVQPCDAFFSSRAFLSTKINLDYGERDFENSKMTTIAGLECGYVRALALAAQECESREV